jgi:NAD(P)-dependent dehydrogenase (short-subunit alcohol dehydrogenase family)
MNINKFEKFNLSGKTALITGGAGMLGIEHSAALIASGATIILTDIDLIKLKEAEKILKDKDKNSKIIIKLMDITNQLEIRKVSKELLEKKIRVDILINNAAINPKVNAENEFIETSRLENFNIEQWNLQIAVGLTGSFLCSQVFGSAMAWDGEGGVILNISSDLSIISPDQRLYRKEGISLNMQPVKPVTYSVIKAGLIGLTRYLSTYWIEQGVRANALSPGGVYDGQGEEFVKKLNSLIPLGRMSKRDEYHSVVQFLCSDASSYLNGQNIVMDGGRSIW